VTTTSTGLLTAEDLLRLYSKSVHDEPCDRGGASARGTDRVGPRDASGWQELGLSNDEVVFYDALATSASAVQVLGEGRCR